MSSRRRSGAELGRRARTLLALALDGAAGPVRQATWRLALIALAVSAAKVGLFAVAGSAFLAAYGAEGLPWCYLALALLAASTALLLAPRLERACAVRTLCGLLLAMALIGSAVCGLLAFDLPGVPALLLVLAHAYNIASEILLWLLAAAWLPPPDLRRAQLWTCLSTALGGFAGGLLAERLVSVSPALAGAAATLMGCLYGALLLRRSLALPRAGSAKPLEIEEEATAEPEIGWGELARHPLGPLLAAGSFMLTLVWGLTEFLSFAVYERFLPQPATLARFLAALYAVQQLAEFLCVVLLTGPVTRRFSPLARSVLFPCGSLLTLVAMGRGFGLGTAALAHTHAEALSNGLFDPVHAANFAAVPQRLQARVRAASEGVCYPLSMAAGGLVLLLGPGADNLEAVLAITIGAALLFLAVTSFTGLMVTPTLLGELGLTAELGASPRRAQLRAAERALAPWVRRTRLRQHLLAVRVAVPGRERLERRVARANRRALAAAFAEARRCDPGDLLPRLEVMIDSRRLDRRALVAETVLSLPVRRLFVPILPALRMSYLG